MTGRARRRLRRIFVTSCSGRRRGTPITKQALAAILLAERPGIGRVLAGIGGATLAGVLGGPVAAVVCGAYAGIGISYWHTSCARRRAARARRESIDAISEIAAELRAGMPLLAAGRIPDPDAAFIVAAARRVSERLGAPLADLLDRVEADLRARTRADTEVAAQLAGTRATAVLLSAMPLAGVALGASLGTDPLHHLLHTRAGALCALTALGLQCLGLLFTSWLVRGVTGASGSRGCRQTLRHRQAPVLASGALRRG
ncbi:MAG: type II secretion system F family protein [Micromonosporaceae bacterium]|nr:type II secretion system F family protein [Micromonosporaceae bacterium]